jgi:hypothetical protein
MISGRLTGSPLGSTGLMLTQSPMGDIMQKPYSDQSGVVVNRYDPASCGKDNGTLDETKGGHHGTQVYRLS